MTTLVDAGLADVVAAEGAAAGSNFLAPLPGRRSWLAAVGLLAVAASAWFAGIGRKPIVNPGGWTLFARFWRGALHPDLSPDLLRRTASASLTTLTYAVLGTALSLVLGLVGGLLISRRALSMRIRRDRPGLVARAVRVALVVPRGIHEAVWALLLLSVIGRDSLVAVLAIGIPYGAITAKVYADIVDTGAAQQHRLLRAAGAGRLPALAYGMLPAAGADLASYGFYRLECALRAAVVLGMVGAGGLGFQLSQSFQGLAYGQLWTSLYVLIALGSIAEWWSARVRRGGPPARRPTIVAGSVLVVASWLYLRPDVGRLWSSATARRAARWWRESWPLRLPRGGGRELWRAAMTTVHMSFLALVVAVAIAAPLALVAARRRATRRRATGDRATDRRAIAPAAVRAGARLVALTSRSIPPTVWALLALFVLFPGVVPGAVALGIYTAGVLARLFAETLENADDRSRSALTASGTGAVAAFAYATAPVVAPRWAAYALYRWEVAARDAAVVGVVGVAGLGRLLAAQTAAFAFGQMAATVLALVGVTVFVDIVSTVVRGGLR